MANSIVKKNGLLYSEDMHTLLGVDSESEEFNGRVPFGVHFINDEVFADSEQTSISLPDSVKSVGANLFCNCKRLLKVKLPSSLCELSPYMFSGCSALQKIVMPNQVDSFPEGLFYGCSSLTEIPFRAGLSTLSENVFAGCSSLKSLVIPDTVIKIESCAVQNCSSLESIVIPSSVQFIAPDAFDGCNLIHNIRISSDNKLFYISEKDGCLYERTAEEDRCIIKINKIENKDVDFFENNLVDTEEVDNEEEDNEEDDLFSAEIGAMNEESSLINENENKNTEEHEKMTEDIDSIFNEIMSDEKETLDSTNENIDVDKKESEVLVDAIDIVNEHKSRLSDTQNVGVDEKEGQVLAQMMEVMNEKKPEPSEAKVSTEELEKLFSTHEEKEPNGQADNSLSVNNPSNIDKKVRILLDAAKVSKILEFDVEKDLPFEPDLFVIAEKTVANENGEEEFSSKLLACVSKIAHIQNFNRVYLVSELPFDNEEFVYFYSSFISKKNVILACEAARPSLLSDYCKSICEKSRISLDKKDLNDQRKRLSIKNNTLIKLVLQDKYC